jgi:hypothetical protein
MVVRPLGPDRDCSADDAEYVAPAEALRLALVTTDQRVLKACANLVDGPPLAPVLTRRAPSPGYRPSVPRV